MALQITNSLTRSKETFQPMEEGRVKMYVCGPTVYNFIHVGNARPLIFFDVVRRFLEFLKYDVTYVMNYTDVDDRIIERARKDGVPSTEVSEKYVAEYETDMKLLGVKCPHQQPKVTTHIPQIVAFIQGLVDNGSAYVADDGEVFFAVRKFKEYGKLSGKNIDDLIAGARVSPDEKKRDPLDFSLWKPRKTADEPAWESPWGKGRPGWHIECSAMSVQYLGETFDIHGGGMDLIHPHHENEVAQSEALTHKPFVRYWMHNNMLTMEKEKMSKSIGNIFLTRDFIKKHGAETLKFLLLSGHYRSTIDFSPRHVRESQAGLHRIYSALKRAELLRDATAAGGKTSPEEAAVLEIAKTFSERWKEAMLDDFNTAKLLGYVFEYVRAYNAYADKKGFKTTQATSAISSQLLEQMRELSGVLNLFGETPEKFLSDLKRLVLEERGIQPSDIEEKIRARTEARARKDFAASDAIRAELMSRGVELRDSPQGTEWDISFSEVEKSV